MRNYILALGIILFFVTCKKDIKPGETNPLPPVQSNKAPKLVTNPASNLSVFAVVLSGKLTDTGGSKIIQVGIVVDTVAMATVKKHFNQFVATQINPDGSFSSNIGYLPSNVTFYVRAYAINSTDTAYGNEVKFTTLVQKIFKGDVNLTTQQEATSFGAQHYTVIDGALNISGSVNDLSTLLGLAVINTCLSKI